MAALSNLRHAGTLLSSAAHHRIQETEGDQEMNRGDFNRLVDTSLCRRMTLSQKKSADYATDDVLSNFKRMAHIATILRVDVTAAHGVALFYALLKIDRLCNLLVKETLPQNESLQDTVDDLKNYIDLMEACLIDEGIL